MADIEDKIKPQVNFADGTFAFIKRIIPDILITENGVKEIYHDFVFRPTFRTILKWDLKEKKEQDFVENGIDAGFYKKRYKKILCQQLDPNPKTQVWDMHCDWNGKPIDKFNGKLTEMQDVIYGLKKESDGLRRGLIRMGYEFMKMSKDPTLYMEKSAGNWTKILEKMNIVVAQPNREGQESGR